MSHKKLLLVPFLVLLYFFIHYISDFWHFLQPLAVAKTVTIYFITVTMLLLIGFRFFKQKLRFLLWFSTLLFLFLFYGSFIDTGIALKWMQPVNHVDFKMAFIFIAVGAVITFIFYRIRESLVHRLLKFWFIYCSALIVYDTVVFFLYAKPETNYLNEHKTITPFIARDKPTVFFLLFDMYPSDTVLRRYLQFDNTANADFLRGKGFYVTGNARSLYDETYNSLASTFNLQPLEFYNDNKVKDYKKPLLALKNMEASLVPMLFKKAGYTFRNYSVFDIGDEQSPLQFNLTYHLKNAFTGATFFNRFYDAFETDFFFANRGINTGLFKTSWSNQVKADINFLNTSFENLINSFPEQKPSFNYFHFMIPHPPIIYDSTGHELPMANRYAFNGFDGTNKQFVEYVKYGNKVIEHFVNRIFEKAGRNVVIILQGDHGYREFSSQFPDAVRYGAMNAVYLPDKNYVGLNDSTTVLAAFKQVLRHEFNYSELNEK